MTSICETCGKSYSHAPSRNLQYCSRACRTAQQTLPLKVRLEKYTDKSGGPGACWPWTGGTTSAGYGVIIIRGKGTTAHRISYQEYVGPLPENCDVMHHCDNPPCQNPDHLEAVPHHINAQDMVVKGRARGGAINPLKGELAPWSRLREADVLEIRSSQESASTLASRFNVATDYIYMIRNRKTWKHLKP